LAYGREPSGYRAWERLEFGGRGPSLGVVAAMSAGAKFAEVTLKALS